MYDILKKKDVHEQTDVQYVIMCTKVSHIILTDVRILNELKGFLFEMSLAWKRIRIWNTKINIYTRYLVEVKC